MSYCNWDYLEIFDGTDTSAPSLGQYCNSLTGSPGTIISSGGAVTIYLHADQSVNGRGFEVNWSCVYPNFSNGLVTIDSVVVSTPISCFGDLADIEVYIDNDTCNPLSPCLLPYQLKVFKPGAFATVPYLSSSVTTLNQVIANNLGEGFLLYSDS